jgi:hypothetical protein
MRDLAMRLLRRQSLPRWLGLSVASMEVCIQGRSACVGTWDPLGACLILADIVCMYDVCRVSYRVRGGLWDIDG